MPTLLLRPGVGLTIPTRRQQTEPHTALFASRMNQFSGQVRRQWKRRLIGRVFGLLVSTVLGIRIHDSQCGLKFIPRAAYQRIAPFLRIHGFAFDVELLAALHDAGVPVEGSHRMARDPGGHVHLIRDSLRMAAMFGASASVVLNNDSTIRQNVVF
ncbi:MAG: hypothetical protein R3F13_03795 [Prosthecobacter sp.]